MNKMQVVLGTILMCSGGAKGSIGDQEASFFWSDKDSLAIRELEVKRPGELKEYLAEWKKKGRIVIEDYVQSLQQDIKESLTKRVLQAKIFFILFGPKESTPPELSKLECYFGTEESPSDRTVRATPFGYIVPAEGKLSLTYVGQAPPLTDEVKQKAIQFIHKTCLSEYMQLLLLLSKSKLNSTLEQIPSFPTFGTSLRFNLVYKTNLAVRKEIRDEVESKLKTLEKELSKELEIRKVELGVPKEDKLAKEISKILSKLIKPNV